MTNDDTVIEAINNVENNEDAGANNIDVEDDKIIDLCWVLHILVSGEACTTARNSGAARQGVQECKYVYTYMRANMNMHRLVASSPAHHIAKS